MAPPVAPLLTPPNSSTSPPAPVFPAPTERIIDPDFPVVASPVIMVMAPDAPELVVPEENESDPLTPVVPAFTDFTIISPLVVDVP